MNKKIKSKRFGGGWEMRCNGLKQHNMSSKEFIKVSMDKGSTREAAKIALDNLIKSECWYSDCGRYKVVKKDLVYKEGCSDNLIHSSQFDGMTWLSIRINNGKTFLRDWREFQAIKNDLCGEDRQAIEIYPPENIVHDTDNVFHLWVFKQDQGLMIGWLQRDVTYDESPYQRQDAINPKERRLRNEWVVV